MANVMDQFEIIPLVAMPPVMGYNIDFTNSSLFMLVAACSILLFLGLGVRGRAMVPGRYQSLVELSYNFVAGTLRDTVGNEGRPYFPFIFSLFMFILFCNLLGMIPFSFTVTSHIIVTFALAGFIFISVMLIAIAKHGFGKFIRNFLPHGTPIWLAPLIFVIEIISYLARPISLSIRLAANMMAGHVMLKVIAGFVFTLGLLGIAPFALLILLTGFEIFVAILQAYIFTVLTCVYLNDALHLH
jgi:F-type H+-transporting ATPase subunit a